MMRLRIEYLINWYNIYQQHYQKGNGKYENEAYKQWCLVMGLWETHDMIHREGE